LQYPIAVALLISADGKAAFLNLLDSLSSLIFPIS
jgi:hypothetical protein